MNIGETNASVPVSTRIPVPNMQASSTFQNIEKPSVEPSYSVGSQQNMQNESNHTEFDEGFNSFELATDLAVDVGMGAAVDTAADVVGEVAGGAIGGFIEFLTGLFGG